MQVQPSEYVALVTGAGNGIGKATALRLAKEGFAVAVLSIEEDKTRETADEIIAAGGKGLAIIADISDPQAMQKAVAQVVDTFGRLTTVVASAGINGVWAPIDEIEPDEWDKTIDTNLKGTFLTLKYSVPHLKKQGGAVTIIASVNGTRTFSNMGATAYSCSKAGQVALAKMAALELAPSKVRVNVVCPGAISTNIEEGTQKRGIEKVKTPIEFPEGSIPLTHGEPGKPDQVADLIYFLSSEAASHISGTEVWIDGAGSLLT